jgi:conjugative transposon TraN protein
MNKIIKLFFMIQILLIGNTTINAQDKEFNKGLTKKIPSDRMIVPYGVQVTFNKTTHLIFPSAIRYVDLGSDRIIAGKAEEAENVLRVKAAVEGFLEETNFSVICEDGNFYSFNVKYAQEPDLLNIEIKDLIAEKEQVDSLHSGMEVHFKELGDESASQVKLIMESIYKNNEKKIRHLSCKRFGIKTMVKSIYVDHGLLYFHLLVKNKSNLPFNVDFIRFKIVDKKVMKRTAIQETVITPIRCFNEELVVDGNSTLRTVYVLPLFTIPDDKIIELDIFEKNGGRHQTIRIKSCDLMSAKVIDELKIEQKRILN